MRVSEASRLCLFIPSLVSRLLDLLVSFFPFLDVEAAIEVATVANPLFLDLFFALMLFRIETSSCTSFTICS